MEVVFIKKADEEARERGAELTFLCPLCNEWVGFSKGQEEIIKRFPHCCCNHHRFKRKGIGHQRYQKPRPQDDSYLVVFDTPLNRILYGDPEK